MMLLKLRRHNGTEMDLVCLLGYVRTAGTSGPNQMCFAHM